MDQLLSAHYGNGFGFIVAVFRDNEEKHPLGYVHTFNKIFFVPTRHYHNGEEEETEAHWDHEVCAFVSSCVVIIVLFLRFIPLEAAWANRLKKQKLVFKESILIPPLSQSRKQNKTCVTSLQRQVVLLLHPRFVFPNLWKASCQIASSGTSATAGEKGNSSKPRSDLSCCLK